MNSEQLKAEITKLQAQLKEAQLKERANTKYYYTVENNGEVVMHKAQALPKSGVYAHWTGESGAKTLQTVGNFSDELKKHPIVFGKGCIRISNLLKKAGFAFDGKTKTWSSVIPV